ncbi:hypothetical protein HanRHA438_Chr15g0696361 [Helianthus annuus]|nr:hypothetical protein HanRHA438_Chr15g0696361 [Helianthus annuus]
MEKVTKCVTRDNEVVARYCFVGHYEHWTPLCLVQNHTMSPHLTKANILVF